MRLDIISYHDLCDANQQSVRKNLEAALLQKGIVGIKDVPEFENKTRTYIQAARAFSALDLTTKQQYAPERDAKDTEGYELGAEWFKNQNGEWQIDDKKASYYAFVPDHPRNKWPSEVDLKTSYLALGELIFHTGKIVLDAMGLNASMGLRHDELEGYGRMLHYHKENDATNANPNWCGSHLDHGVFTGLVPAYYFRDGKEIPEPEEAGLHIVPSDGEHFEKIEAADKSILLFQVGEFGQIISNDRIKATRHCVKKARGGIERFAFAVFYNAADHAVFHSTSQLKQDVRYSQHQAADGSISYGQWKEASYDRYRAK